MLLKGCKMTVYENIIEILKKNKIKYEEFHHQPLISAKESAEARVGSMSESVKSLIFKTGMGKFILVLMRGDKRVDAKSLKLLEDTDDLHLADAAEVEKISGVKVGAVGPFGLKTKLKTYFYKGILENEYSWFSPGDNTVSVKIKSKDLLKMIENPIMFD